MVLEKTLERPLDCKEIKPVNPKGNQPWIFIGKTDAKAETPILWPPDAKNWLIGKDPDAGKDWRQEKKGKTEDEMAGWHHQLDGHEFEQALGVGDGQGSLVCCRPQGGRVRYDWASEPTDYIVNTDKWLKGFVDRQKTSNTAAEEKNKVKKIDLLLDLLWSHSNQDSVVLKKK